MQESLDPSNHPGKIWQQLPLHPQPASLESVTSYITRLAQANGLQSIAELATLAGLTHNWQSLRSFPDGSIANALGLTTLTGWTRTDLDTMTFLPLGRHFGRANSTQTLRRFLQGSLASHLRYCPLCLAEHDFPYYRLSWRFLILSGCRTHHCWLLDHCGHCGPSLPLFVRSPHLAQCPICQGDLRTSWTDQLPKELLETTRVRADDLEMLLTPIQWTLEEAQAKIIGKRFAFLRQQRNLSTAEMAHRVGANERVILDIEYPNMQRQPLFNHYTQYANALDHSLQEIFDVDALQALLVPLSEKQVLEKIHAAVQQLQARGEPVTQGNIGDIIGVPASRLKQYPLAQALLNRCRWEQSAASVKFNSQREDELVKQVEQTIRQLEDRGEIVAVNRICNLVGLSYQWMIVILQHLVVLPQPR